MIGQKERQQKYHWLKRTSEKISLAKKNIEKNIIGQKLQRKELLLVENKLLVNRYWLSSRPVDVQLVLIGYSLPLKGQRLLLTAPLVSAGAWPWLGNSLILHTTTQKAPSARSGVLRGGGANFWSFRVVLTMKFSKFQEIHWFSSKSRNLFQLVLSHFLTNHSDFSTVIACYRAFASQKGS